MKRILLLGAGMVARPLVHYLLAVPEFHLTIASRTRSKADALIGGRPRGSTTTLLAKDTAKLAQLVAEHDLTISLLPAPLHPTVAQLCIENRRHMVTTSYISPAMRELDGAARQAGVLVLNEIGVDPGTDHMSAMRIIDDIKRRGGQVVSFRSSCGGLPAPLDNDNPFGYKFSWSPRAVCTACQRPAEFREGGSTVKVPGPELFGRVMNLHVEGVGELESYPNADSLGYIEQYGLQGIDTMYRGTFRYPGWCQTLQCMVQVGYLDETPATYPPGTTYAEFTRRLTGADQGSTARAGAARQLGLDDASPILDRMQWLGLFDDRNITPTDTETTPLDVLAGLMAEKMPYQPGERDMIVMRHDFLARMKGAGDEQITSTLLAFGEPEGDSAMARTVSLPAAIATRLILQGQVNSVGVHAPVVPEIYNPVLDELTELGIRFEEQTTQVGASKCG